jgi:arylsulfatase A-like enzyme
MQDTASQRPNILLFIADGMQARVLSPGHDCQTPTIDALMQRGMHIVGAHTPLPTCSPARASLMTGLLPHNHGVLEVEHGVDDDQCVLRDQYPHWAQHLRESGYATSYFGKWHIERSGDLQRFGWDVFDAPGRATHRDASQKGQDVDDSLDPDTVLLYQGPDGYNDTLKYAVTDAPVEDRPVGRSAALACDWLNEAPTDQPWCCCVSYYEPNEALIVGREAYDKYDVDQIKLPENMHDDMADKPALYRRDQQIWQGVSDAEWRQALACYYGRITELDGQLAQLLATLESNGQLENTVVIVTADHGRYMGGHGLDAHNFGAFEEIYAVPMVVAGPGVAQGVEAHALVGFHDLCPTILELAGLAPFDVADSRSFLDVLRDPAAAEHHRQGYAEYHGSRFRLTQRVYWEDEWKFVFNGFDFDELYNLADDPWEMTNLAELPEHAERIRNMMTAIWRCMHDTGDNTLLNTHYHSMRFAAVGPNSGKRDS